MSKLAVRSELLKLATTLDLQPEALDFLTPVAPEQLRAFRVAIYEQLFREDAMLFRRAARVGRRLPPRVLAKLGQRVGPLITARMAAEMPARLVAEAAPLAPTEFWADACVHLDPRRTHDAIRQLPVDKVTAVAQELARRHDYITMSRFVEFLTEEQIRAVIDAIEDEGVLLSVAFFMGSKNRIDHLFQALPPERLRAVIRLMADESRDLLAEFLSLLIHVSYRLKRRFGDLAAEEGEAVLTAYVRGAHEAGVWSDVLQVVASMSDDTRRRVVNLPVLRELEVQEGIISAADEQNLWGVVMPMAEMMDDANREAVAQIVARRERPTLEAASNAALTGEHWEALLDLVRRMPAPKRTEFAAIVTAFGEVDPELVDRVARRAQAAGLEDVFPAPGASGRASPAAA